MSELKPLVKRRWKPLSALLIGTSVAAAIVVAVIQHSREGRTPGNDQSAKAPRHHPEPVVPDKAPIPAFAAAAAKEALANRAEPAVHASPPRRAKTFPTADLDTPAATLYARIAAAGASLANAAEVAKFARTVDRCWSASNYDRIARSVSPTVDPKTHGGAQQVAQVEREATREICADLPPNAFDRADQWIAQLAAQGDPQSMFAYGTQAFWVRDPINALRDPARLIEYRKNTASYLDALIDQGYADALVAMGSIKLNPAWGEPNPGDVWAYMYAAARARGDTALEARLLHTVSDRVPASDREKAIEFSNELARRCCER